jgi:glutamine synthetase adenylyltransferase
VQSFLQEARVFIFDSHSDESKGTVKKTQQLIEEIFADFKLTGKAADRNTKSYTDYRTLDTFIQVVSSISSQLLPSLENADLIIPENLTCLGAFWIEDWGQRKTEEAFTFEAWRKNIGQKIENLGNGRYRTIEREEFSSMGEYDFAEKIAIQRAQNRIASSVKGKEISPGRVVTSARLTDTQTENHLFQNPEGEFVLFVEVVTTVN